MNSTHSPLINSTTSHQITQLMNTVILIVNLTSAHHYWWWRWSAWWIFDDWWWMLGRKCQICGDRGKTLKFTEATKIHKFGKFRNAREKSTASMTIHLNN